MMITSSVRLLGFCSLIGVVFPAPAQQQEAPTIDGKSVAAWSKALRSQDAREQGQAIVALLGCDLTDGGKTVPGLVALLKDEDPRVRFVATRALANYHPNAREAVPALTGALKGSAVASLVQALNDDFRNVRIQAARALWQLDRHPRAILALAAELEEIVGKDAEEPQQESVDAGIRASILDLLRNIGPEAKPAIPALARVLADQGWADRWQAASILEGIGRDSKVALPALVVALHDSDWNTRAAAASALGALGPDAKGTGFALQKRLKDQNTTVRLQAATALWKIDEDTAVIPALVEILKDKNESVRQSACMALGRIGARAKPAVPALAALLADPQETVRLSAAQALGAIGPSAHAAVPALLKALKDEAASVRELAAESLRKIDRVAATNAGVP